MNERIGGDTSFPDHSGFEWIDFSDWESSIVVFMRKAKNPEDFLLIVCNFTPVPRSGYRVGAPLPCWYREVLNSDAEFFGGTNLGNGGGLQAEPVPCHGRPCSLNLSLPPLSCLIFKPEI